jgi:hypothetical protein
MFMQWLIENEDLEDEVEVLQKTLLKDYNNGCLPGVSSVKDVLVHFLNKHPNVYLGIRDSFALAIRAYDKELKK